MQEEKTVLTYAKFSPSNIVLYPSYELFNLYRGYDPESQKNLQDNRVKGILSDASSKKITRLVYAWVFSIQAELDRLSLHKSKMDRYISFITLTLPGAQFHSDKEIKRDLLNWFLIRLKRDFNVSVYLWKAESQNNGNIHFHILVNVFIPWQKIREVWNQCLDKYGYIDLFESKHKHRNPNSTDIHGLYKDKKGDNIGNIGAYLAKYMSKNEDLKRGIDGRLWGCSDNLKNIKPFKILIDGNWDWRVFLRWLNFQKGIKKTEKEYFLLLSGSYLEKLKNKFPKLYLEFTQHHKNEFKKLYNLDS